MKQRTMCTVISCLILWSNNLKAEILLCTYAHNCAEFIAMQYRCFKKNLLNSDWQLVVFNDATQPKHYSDIVSTCRQLNIRCIDIPQAIHTQPYLFRPASGFFSAINSDITNASVRNSVVVQWSLDNYGFRHQDIVCLFDSDIFLIKKLDIRKAMRGYSIAATPERGWLAGQFNVPHDNAPTHLWIGLVFLDMRLLPDKRQLNFNCGVLGEFEVDPGGFTSEYLQAHPDAKVLWMDRVKLSNLVCHSCYQVGPSKGICICQHNTQRLRRLGLSLPCIRFAQQAPIDVSRMRNSLGIDDQSPEFCLRGSFVHYRSGRLKDSRYGKKKLQALRQLIDGI